MSVKPLTLGMVGEKVAALHQALTEQGFSIPEAETKKQFFGPATRMAVGEFQTAHGIEPSCEVCMSTAAKLGTTLAANAANYSQPQGQVLTAHVGSAANDNQPPVKVEYLEVGTKQQPIQNGSKRKMPTHLSVFALAKSTGHPIARMPFYAEVGVVSFSALPQPKCNLQEAIQVGIKDFITSNPVNFKVSPITIIRAWAEKLVEPLCAALYRLLAAEIVDRWVKDQASAAGAIAGIIQTASELAKARNLDWNNPQMLGQLLDEAILAYAKAHELPLAEANAQGTRIVWAHPLGVLATDHVGYLSFDLTRLPQDVADAVALALEARRQDPSTPTETSIWISPMAQEEGRIDALAQMRFAHDAIVVKLELDVELDLELCQPKLCESIKNLGIMAMQNPDLTDWRLSPGSFATNPSTLVGDDGCENLFPAQIALQEFTIRQVVRLTDTPPEITVPKDYKMAYVDDYKVTWHSLGHSLGEILYSLPLAPGESVKLAVIDWSWDSLTKRDEQTKLTEEMLHQTHRDRTITETVKAGLKEMQRGSSFMGGVATSAGAAGSYAGIGGAIGNAWSLGGSTATSEGSRDLVGENIQRLSDSFSQASSSQRELNSTVVIQARQEEKESIQTRTFSNYNHSHTLTILYYEVLRHFKMTVEWVRRRPAVLAKIPSTISTFDATTLISYRFILEPVLLDQNLKSAFNALEKQETIREYQRIQGITASDASINPWWEGDIEFSLFEFGIKTAEGLKDKTDGTVFINLILVDGTTVTQPLLQAWQRGELVHNINTNDRLNDVWMGWFIAKPDKPIKWRTLKGFEFVLHVTDEWRMDRLAINGIHGGGVISLLDNADVDYWFGPTEGSSNTVTWIKPPGPYPAQIPPPHRAPDKSLTAEETYSIKKLTDHFASNKDYYNRLILLNTDTALIAMKFEENPTGWLTDNADPYPLEVSGSYVAYPMAKVPGQLVVNSEKSERLMTLPTRGVFAEGKLGHCNISEEIDNTRFWKWEEHPIPFEAPGINPATPITPQPQQTNIAPTAFPQSLVNIVNPSPAPDPTGLASAMNVLTASNIFRDMSGRAEVADLLKKLSDNSVAIAGVAQNAATGGAGKGVAGGGAGTGSTGGSANTGSSPSSGSKSSGSSRVGSAGQRSATPQTVAEVNDLASGIRNQLPPDQANPMIDQLYQNVVDKAGADSSDGSLFQNVSDNPSATTASTATDKDINAYIPINDFIKYVEEVEKAYPNDDLKKTLTRIRQHYYPMSATSWWSAQKDGAAFDQLIPDAPISEGFGGQRRLMREGVVNKSAFEHLTSKANENGVKDNPSPYVIVDGKLIDIGHAFLGLDALLHPLPGRPYTTYGIPNIDPASWVADLALAVYWTVTYERDGKPDTAPDAVLELVKKINNVGQLGRPIGFDDFYKMSASESDLLGNADAFGLFQKSKGQSKLSQLLSDYYLGDSPGFKQRWRIFCASPNDLTYSIKPDNGTVVWADGYTQKWIPRIERMCDLFDDGATSLVAISPSRRPWKYSLKAAIKFQNWVKDELEKEINTKQL